MKKLIFVLFLLMGIAKSQSFSSIASSSQPMNDVISADRSDICCIFAKPQKLFVVSDIEGELTGFKSLLIANKILTQNEAWDFGKGHLVICGDLFDRGKQVIELLHFLKQLEDEAKKASGYIHVILGNHDIMNMSGDYRYVDQKYLDNNGRPSREYLELFSKGSELGDWLRSKNIVEKIGDLLFMHAGISPEILKMNYSIAQLNALCRPYYDVNRKELPLDRKGLFGAGSPFWYRGYFMEPKASAGLVDSTLKAFDVKHIVVGHTILDSNITCYYDGKVIGIDVDTHAGHYAGLLINNNKVFVVDDKGGRKELLVPKKSRDYNIGLFGLHARLPWLFAMLINIFNEKEIPL